MLQVLGPTQASSRDEARKSYAFRLGSINEFPVSSNEPDDSVFKKIDYQFKL